MSFIVPDSLYSLMNCHEANLSHLLVLFFKTVRSPCKFGAEDAVIGGLELLHGSHRLPELSSGAGGALLVRGSRLESAQERHLDFSVGVHFDFDCNKIFAALDQYS